MAWMLGECNVWNEEAIWPWVSKPRKEMDDHTFLWFLTMADIQMKLSEYLERHRFPQYFIGLCPLTSCCPTSTLIFERWLFKARVWKSISCLLEASSNPSLPGEVPNLPWNVPQQPLWGPSQHWRGLNSRSTQLGPVSHEKGPAPFWKSSISLKRPD